MQQVLDVLFRRTWWEYHRHANLPFSATYHWFNVFEGCVWLVFCGLVLWRYAKHRHSRIEIWYAFLFFTFALSDFREAWAQQSWLIWLKLINLIGLLVLRRIVMQRYYPTAKLY